MLTLLGIKRLKKKLVLLGEKSDPEVNAVLQAAVDGINVIKQTRYPSPPPTP